jgi:hypothetical protein
MNVHDELLAKIAVMVNNPDTQVAGLCAIVRLQGETMRAVCASYERRIRRINRRWWVAYLERERGLCEECYGTGYYVETRECSYCEGSGKFYNGMIDGGRESCCEGSGKFYNGMIDGGRESC